MLLTVLALNRFQLYLVFMYPIAGKAQGVNT